MLSGQRAEWKGGVYEGGRGGCKGVEGLFKATRRLRPDIAVFQYIPFTPVGNTHNFVRDHLNFHWIGSVRHSPGPTCTHIYSVCFVHRHIL